MTVNVNTVERIIKAFDETGKPSDRIYIYADDEAFFVWRMFYDSVSINKIEGFSHQLLIGKGLELWYKGYIISVIKIYRTTMNTEQLCFGQRYDEELGILEPWYTNPAMDRIKQMPIHNQVDVILEWGGGASTLWWAKRAKSVYSVDHNADWVVKVCDMFSENKISNAEIKYVPTHEGDQSAIRDEYIYQYKHIKPTICIVDGVHRYECAEAAVKYYKPTVLIIDNHQQDYVFMCPALDELLKGVKMERFIQPNHTDHSGNPWATAIFYLK